jgi:hypothetical protein
MTCGALVAKTFERWLYSQADAHRDALKFCVRKLGLLDPDAKTYKLCRGAYEKAVGTYHSVADLRAGLESKDDTLKIL